MRGEMVYYMTREESSQLVNELDFLFRRTFGDIEKSHEQMLAQVPCSLTLLYQLAQFMPAAVDLTQYFPQR